MPALEFGTISALGIDNVTDMGSGNEDCGSGGGGGGGGSVCTEAEEIWGTKTFGMVCIECTIMFCGGKRFCTEMLCACMTWGGGSEVETIVAF